jgi:hypothetical protein
MEQIEDLLRLRAEEIESHTWRGPSDEEALVAHEKNMFAALVGPSDPIPYEATCPNTVARLRQTAARQHHHRHLRDAVGRTHPLRSPAASLLLERSAGGGGLHCSSSSSRSVRARTTAPP